MWWFRLVISNKYNILDEINKFWEWQCQKFPNVDSYDISGEWETEYNDWNKIYTAFSYMLQSENVNNADEQLMKKLIYIIARDNECEVLIDELTANKEWFEVLCKLCLSSDESDAKWQFVSRLPECQCEEDIKNLVLKFAEDKDEYVSRRALLVMPQIRPDKVEYYASLFWENKSVYKDVQEYRIMALLKALKEISSPLFDVYLTKAKQIDSKVIQNYISQIK